MTETGTEQESDPDERRVEILEHERVFDGFLAIDRYTVVHEQYDGSMSDPASRLVLERGDSAAVLPYHPETGQVILVQQFRLPARIRHDPAWLWEIIAGTVEPDRTPEEVARSEALEEAGYRLGHLSRLTTVYPSPGGSSERIFLYWSDLSQAERVSSGGGQAESGEDIRVATFTLGEALAMIRDDTIVDAKTIIALQQVAMAGEALV
jgi:nudix-type nucleoside diphosphatase (YffH/AdpP family)